MLRLRTKQIDDPFHQLPESVQPSKQDYREQSDCSRCGRGNPQRQAERNTRAGGKYATEENISEANPPKLSISLKLKLQKLGICRANRNSVRDQEITDRLR